MCITSDYVHVHPRAGEWLSSYEGPRRMALISDTSATGAPLVPPAEGPGLGRGAPARVLSGKGGALLGMLEAFWEARKPGAFLVRPHNLPVYMIT